jgi:hypothetical protein
LQGKGNETQANRKRDGEMPKLTITADEVTIMLVKIRESKQFVPVWFWDLTAEEITGFYNGVGSNLTWKPLRHALTWIYRWAPRSIVIHDTIWSCIKRFGLTEKDFYLSNKDLKRNARIELTESVSKWFRPILYGLRYSLAWDAQRACNNLGKTAWNAHSKEKKKRIYNRTPNGKF